MPGIHMSIQSINPSGYIEEICHPMSFFGYFDESGKWKDHKIVSFGGFISDFTNWQSFNSQWERLKRKHEIDSLHMSGGGLTFKRSITSKRAPLTLESRIEILFEFIDAIKSTLEYGIAVAVDVAAFKALHSEDQRILGHDANLVAFRFAMIDAVNYVNLTPGATFSLICDDEQYYAKKSYDMMSKLKQENLDIKNKVVSICFGNDRHFIQLQAADLLVYLVRAQSELTFYSKDYRFSALFNRFEESRPGIRLRAEAKFLDAKILKDLARAAHLERRKHRR